MNVIPMIAPMPFPDDEQPMNVFPMKAPMFPDNEQPMNVLPMNAPLVPDNEPNENSSLEELAAYALLKQKSIIANDKKNAEDMWLMGQALEWAYEKTPHGQWEKWFKAKKLTKTLVWQARTLHERATLDQVKNIGLTKALRKFKVVAAKKAKSEAASVPIATTDKVEDADLTPGSTVEATEPTDEAEGNDEEGVEQPTDTLAEEEVKEHKALQNTLRQLTPKTSAVAILHALELLRDELNAEDVDQELQETFGKIAELAEEMKEVSKQIDVQQAA